MVPSQLRIIIIKIINRKTCCELCVKVMRSDYLKLHYQKNKINYGVKKNINTLPEGGAQAHKNKIVDQAGNNGDGKRIENS